MKLEINIRGKVQKEILDWAVGHGGNSDPAMWRDTFDMELPEPHIEQLNTEVRSEGVTKLIIPEPTDKWIQILIWNIEDFKSHIKTEPNWLDKNKLENGKLIQDSITSEDYARKTCNKLMKRLKKYLD